MDAIAAAVALAAIRAKGLTEEADILEAAIDEALCDEPIVRIAGGVTADQIADKVVEKLLNRRQVVGAKLVQKQIPDGVPAVPWEVGKFGVTSEEGRLVIDEDDMELTPVFAEGSASPADTMRAIVAAMNAYYSPQTPAEAASANSETGIPDTAGYPVPDYDAVDPS
ncbi:MAG: hypothetical protein SFV23_12850 [Planctomycetaceae bacterium]|nr:hypothetical protein [Planctomycetaceae bacterium]